MSVSDPGNASRAAGVVADCDRPAQRPHRLARAVPHAELVLQIWRVASEMCIECLIERDLIFRMNAIEPHGGRRPLVDSAQLQQLEPSRRKVNLATREIPVPDTIAGSGNCQRVAFLAFPERRFRGLACNGVPDGAAQQLRSDVSLDDVVLCALGHHGDRCFLVLHVGEDDYGHIRRRTLHLVQALYAGPVGQIQIEEHDIVADLAEPADAGGEPLHVVDVRGRTRETRNLVTNQTRFEAVVFNQQDAERFLLRMRGAK